MKYQECGAKPDVVLQEIRELDCLTAAAQQWLSQHPDDRIAAFLAEQDTARRSQLVAELLEATPGSRSPVTRRNSGRRKRRRQG